MADVFVALACAPNPVLRAQCGVTLTWLEEFAASVDPDMTTEEVVQRIIIPDTAELKCRWEGRRCQRYLRAINAGTRAKVQVGD